MGLITHPSYLRPTKPRGRLTGEDLQTHSQQMSNSPQKKVTRAENTGWEQVEDKRKHLQNDVIFMRPKYKCLLQPEIRDAQLIYTRNNIKGLVWTSSLTTGVQRESSAFEAILLNRCKTEYAPLHTQRADHSTVNLMYAVWTRSNCMTVQAVSPCNHLTVSSKWNTYVKNVLSRMSAAH